MNLEELKKVAEAAKECVINIPVVDAATEFIAKTSPAAVLELIAEIELLQSKAAVCDAFLDKTAWFQKEGNPKYLGMHLADAMRVEIESLRHEIEETKQIATGRVLEMHTENVSLRQQLAECRALIEKESEE